MVVRRAERALTWAGSRAAARPSASDPLTRDGYPYASAWPMPAHFAGSGHASALGGCAKGDRVRAPLRSMGCPIWLPTLIAGSRARRHGPLSKATRHIKRRAPLEHVVAGAREFVRQRLGRYRRVRLRPLALVEAARLLAVAARKVRRLHKRPRQVAVAVLDVALTLLLAVADQRTVDAPRIGGKVPGGGKPVNPPGLERDHGGQRRANARDRRPQPLPARPGDFFLCTLFRPRHPL